MRLPLTLLAIVALAAAAWGQAGVPGGFAPGVPQTPGTGTVTVTPSGCAGTGFDFTQSCNSQYAGVF
jgi:hypothetical protein